MGRAPNLATSKVGLHPPPPPQRKRETFGWPSMLDPLGKKLPVSKETGQRERERERDREK
jgi:hypothetical protein